MHISIFSLIGFLACIFSFFLVKSFRVHGWHVSDKAILTTGLISLFSMNFFLFQILFSGNSLLSQLFVSAIFSGLITLSIYLVLKSRPSLILHFLLINGLIMSLVTLSLIETSDIIPKPHDSGKFENQALAYQSLIILALMLIIHFLEQKLTQVVHKNKHAYAIYHSVLFVIGIAVIFLPVNELYNKFLTLPLALLFGYIAFNFAVNMFSHHAKHHKEV